MTGGKLASAPEPRHRVRVVVSLDLVGVCAEDEGGLPDTREVATAVERALTMWGVAVAGTSGFTLDTERVKASVRGRATL